MDRAIKDASAVSVVTSNRLGRTSVTLNELNELFVEHAQSARLPVLDLGCAFGVASLAALARGAQVIANDVDEAHLAHVKASAPGKHQARLTTLRGAFPDELDFPDGSLSSVHASNLLNFLSGEQIEAGAHKVFRWLEPDGKVFVISGTPYARNIQGFIPTYEERRRRGVRWPGECEDLRRYSADATMDELPASLHLLDPDVLRRAFEGAGFVVELAELFGRRGIPDYIALDGRENVCLLAHKPAW